MTKYSIILRAYNAQSVLRKSVESVKQQTYPYWELIIVDDGSSDGTGMLADQFARENARIRSVHQENKGCVLATQAGIAASTGAYVVALDADDWYEPDYLEKVDAIVQRINPDMVAVNYNVVSDSGIIDQFRLADKEGQLSIQEAIVWVLETTNASLCNKVVKREKLQYSQEYKNFLVSMGKTSNFGEDLYQLMPVLCNCTSVYLLDAYLYNYYVNEASITRQGINASWDALHQRIRLLETTYHTIQSNGFMTAEIEGLIQRNCMRVSCPVIVQLIKKCKLDGSELSKLKANTFYKDIVARIPHTELKKLTSMKALVALRMFNFLVMLMPHEK